MLPSNLSEALLSIGWQSINASEQSFRSITFDWMAINQCFLAIFLKHCFRLDGNQSMLSSNLSEASLSTGWQSINASEQSFRSIAFDWMAINQCFRAIFLKHCFRLDGNQSMLPNNLSEALLSIRSQSINASEQSFRSVAFDWMRTNVHKVNRL